MANCKADLRCYRVRLNTVPESAFVEAGLFVKKEYSISKTENKKYICFWNNGEDLPASFDAHEITNPPAWMPKTDNLTRKEAAILTQIESENDLASEGWLKKVSS